MMRIRKAQNLTWLAMVNTAATFTDSGKNLAVYFGMLPSLNTMSTKLKDLIPYDKILLCTKNTLSEYGFGIAMFDNSQMFTKLKYQRDGKSSFRRAMDPSRSRQSYLPCCIYQNDIHQSSDSITPQAAIF